MEVLIASLSSNCEFSEVAVCKFIKHEDGQEALSRRRGGGAGPVTSGLTDNAPLRQLSCLHIYLLNVQNIGYRPVFSAWETTAMSESAGPVICAGDLDSELLGKQSVASYSRGEEVPSSGIIFRFNLSTKIDKLRQI